MPTLYDQYQLSNSNQIPQYVGSTIPEIQQVANTFQDRYDFASQQADMIDQAVKTSTASPFDQPALNNLKDQFRQKLQGYAQKGDYENMVRNVTMDARDFVGKYKPIAENQKKLAEYQKQLDDQVEKGTLMPETAKARMAQVADSYTGLKYNNSTGQYDNQFSGAANAKSVNLTDKINKILEGSHAVERGYTVKNIDGDYYQTNGSTSKKLDWKKIKPIVDAGLAIDPEVQSYLHQEKELAPYYAGFSSKYTNDQLEQSLQGNPTMAAAVHNYMAQGYDPKTAYKQAISDHHLSNIEQGINQYAHKGIIDEQTSRHETEYNPIGVETAKKKLDDGIFIPYEGSNIDLSSTVPNDPKELTKNIDGLNSNITDLTRILDPKANPHYGDMDAVQRSKLETQLAFSKESASKLQSQHDLISKEVIGKMGSDYKKLQDMKASKDPVKTIDGKTITMSDFQQAFNNTTNSQTGKPDPTKPWVETVDPSNGMGVGAKVFLHTPDGTEHEVSKDDFTNMMSRRDDINRLQDKYNDVESDVMKDKSTNLSLSPTMVPLSKSIKTQMQSIINNGNPGLIIMDNKGSILKDEDANKVVSHLNLSGITANKVGGDTYYYDATYDNPQQTKGKSDSNNGTKYYIKFAGFDSGSEEAAKTMLKADSPAVRQTGVDILSNPEKDKIINLPYDNTGYEFMPGARVLKSNVNGASSIRIVDSSGKTMTREGRELIFDDPSNAGKAVTKLKLGM